MLSEFLIIFSLFFILSACTELNQKVGLKDDHIMEEVSESYIETKTGLDIDLTPSSPEK